MSLLCSQLPPLSLVFIGKLEIRSFREITRFSMSSRRSERRETLISRLEKQAQYYLESRYFAGASGGLR